MENTPLIVLENMGYIPYNKGEETSCLLFVCFME